VDCDAAGSGEISLPFLLKAGVSPQDNACTDGSLSLEGEGWGEGEHTAVEVIPFTLCSLLLCNGMTCERARVAQSPPPWRPGLPAVNRRFADCSPHPWGSPFQGQRRRCPKLLPAILSSAYSFRLSGRAWPASLQATPSRRIPAPRLGLTETPRRFTVGPGHRCKPLIFLKQHSSLQVKKLPGIPQPHRGEEMHSGYFFSPANAARISSSGSCMPINTITLCGASSPQGLSQSALYRRCTPWNSRRFGSPSIHSIPL